jgi:hypothetical protein
VDEPWNQEVESAAVRVHLDRGAVGAARASLERLRTLRDARGGSCWQPLIVWFEGRIAELEAGACAGARARFDEVRELRPLSWPFRLERARCPRALSRINDAEPEVRWLLERSPGAPEAQVEAPELPAARSAPIIGS